MTKYQSQYGAGGTQYSYYYEEDDSTFQLVRIWQFDPEMYEDIL